MKLKTYQAETLDVLRRFLETARMTGPARAYDAVTQEPEQSKRLGRYVGSYKALEALPGTPYVCLRLPTGGGKTILGAHTVAVARDAWIEKDFPLVLWLVPSNTIRLQTADALKNPRHPYRRVLDEAFDGRVRVFDIADFTHIRPHDIRDNLCIVVGTIQTLRVSNTEGRRVYAHNEDMEPHFSGISPHAHGLERMESGSIAFSFANLLHVHRPLMIVDEAHNAITGLTREMQARVNPCAIIEFTATPRFGSNILHGVSAQELKDEEMIKLPIVLAEHKDWQGAVNGAITTRAQLDEAARGENQYLRPIVLFQAQPKDQEVTVEALKKHLVEVEHIPEDRIAIATGDQRELDGVDLFDPQCRIEYVITVEALKEGWDCSFAYVFCSVSRIQSAIDVEQLLGRVLRMPYAQRRKAPELNKAYAHVSETSFAAAAHALVDKLTDMGFREDEAPDMIEAAQGHFDETGLFAPREKPKPTFRYSVPASPALYAAVRDAAIQGVTLSETEGGRVEIAVTGRIAPDVEQALAEAVPSSERTGFAEAARAYHAEIMPLLSPAERGEVFTVPRLVSEIQGELVFVETETLMEHHKWSLLDHPARLDERVFSIPDTAHGFEIDIIDGDLKLRNADETRQLSLNIEVEGWTPENLAIWLERRLHEQDIHPSELLRWVRDCIGHLTAVRGIPISHLMRAKFLLGSALKSVIGAARRAEQAKAYSHYLFAPEAKASITFDTPFIFRDGMFGDQRTYRGRWRPNKHFLGPDNVPAFDGTEQGDELKCAQALDGLAEVKYWIRNVSQHPNAFWLPLASGKFYPDFVALLNDGRLFVVEYKGAHLADEGNKNTNEKRTVGRLWESLSGGKGLFLMAEKMIDGKEVWAQMRTKLLG
ncbi:DEAD/DEAH box helicase [Microvirga subterranea]|uniref:Type III restriction enzyme n=1 Tax=Microvirga subterranea TaxID=186651 RepID=A0A370HKQ5_9HYPH|nr:DEAD/DEAH box helicase family protein [Microvirga subterranea]RDI59183.1 type III restriction enzyme [Microvirga subterranea]